MGCEQAQSAVGAVTGRGLSQGISVSAGGSALGSPHPHPGTPTLSRAHFCLLEVMHTTGRVCCCTLVIESIWTVSSLLNVKSNWTRSSPLKLASFLQRKRKPLQPLEIFFISQEHDLKTLDVAYIN